MSEHDRPQLSLAEPPGVLKTQSSRIPKKWLCLFLALHLAILVCLALILARSNRHTVSGGAVPGPKDPETLRKIATELEDRGLYREAAAAWGSYLASEPNANEAAILYRIGTLYSDADQLEKAAAHFVQANLAAGDNQDLRAKIRPKLIDCLRRMGRYGEVDRELSRQVEVGGENTRQGDVLATLVGEALTDSDLDRMIEQRVDQMLAMQGAAGHSSTREKILQQFTAPAMRQNMLHDLLQQQLFARRARELKIDRQDTFRSLLDFLEQDLLATQFLDRELQKIEPTDVDLEAYYKANSKQYEEPESIDVVVIELGTDEEPAPVLEQIQSADDFRKLARERQPNPNQPEMPTTRRILRGQYDRMLGDTEPLFALAENEWTPTPHTRDDTNYLVLIDAKYKARIPDFSEVREQVRREYLGRKRQEVTERLFRDLMDRYDVRIVPPKPADKEVDPNSQEVSG